MSLIVFFFFFFVVVVTHFVFLMFLCLLKKAVASHLLDVNFNCVCVGVCVCVCLCVCMFEIFELNLVSLFSIIRQNVFVFLLDLRFNKKNLYQFLIISQLIFDLYLVDMQTNSLYHKKRKILFN